MIKQLLSITSDTLSRTHVSGVVYHECIIRKACKTDGKVPLLNNVQGNQHGLWKIVRAMAALRSNPSEKYGRIAHYLGLPLTASMKDIMDEALSAAHAHPIPPNVVESSPVEENKLTSGEFDLCTLPASLIHQADGVRYVQTFGIHILESPNKSWTN